MVTVKIPQTMLTIGDVRNIAADGKIAVADGDKKILIIKDKD
ncbi:MAG: hypothetical protein WC919_03490 [Candidatus Paceibacterota bacterium]|jgi:hypothetical protein|nr:hypothetical protein [Candidatus Paceibacterota bacterium]